MIHFGFLRQIAPAEIILRALFAVTGVKDVNRAALDRSDTDPYRNSHQIAELGRNKRAKDPKACHSQTSRCHRAIGFP